MNAERTKQTQNIVEWLMVAQSVDEVFRVLAEGLTQVLNASAGTAIMAVEPRTGRMRGQVGRPEHLWPDVRKITISLDDQAAWSVRAVRTRSPVVIDDAVRAPGGKKWLVRLYRHKSMLFVPIVAGGDVFGCAVVAETQRFRHFTDEEADLAMSLATQAAEAIARLTSS